MGKLDTVEVNGPEGEVLDWDAVDWRAVGRCTAAARQFSLGLLEPVAWKAGTAGSSGGPGAATRRGYPTGRVSTTCSRPRAWTAQLIENARDVKNLQGRAKTRSGCWRRWPSGVCARRRWCIPEPIRRLRDLTRYRRALVADRGREMQQRAEKLLGRRDRLLGAHRGAQEYPAGDDGSADRRQTRPAHAGPARAGTGEGEDRSLEEALRGFFTDHHAVMLPMMLDNIDRISAQITVLDGRIAEAVALFSDRVDRLVDLPGVDHVAAAELIGEIEVDTSRFPTAAHLVSWPSSARRPTSRPARRSARAGGKGNPWLGGALGDRVRPVPHRHLPRHSQPATTPNAGASRKRSSRSATRYSQSSPTCWPIPRPASTTSGPSFCVVDHDATATGRRQAACDHRPEFVIRDGKAVIAESAA